MANQSLTREMLALWRPYPIINLSEWCETHLHVNTAKWRSRSYQKFMLNMMGDPAIEHLVIKKSARVGYTQMLLNAMAKVLSHEPDDILMVMPTIKDCRDFSQDELQSLLIDNPKLMGNSKVDEGNILKKLFPGGSLTLVGSSSPAGLRRITVKHVLLDEISAYQPNEDGSTIDLAIKRSETRDDRKIIMGSTPSLVRSCEVTRAYEASTQGEFHSPCPECGTYQPLVWDQFRYSTSLPVERNSVKYECVNCQHLIGHSEKFQMFEKMKFVERFPDRHHRGIFVWTAYSYDRNANWDRIVEAFLTAGEDPRKIRSFQNTWLGEAFDDEKGLQVEYEEFKELREDIRFKRGEVPEGVKYLFAGVDIQADKFVIVVLGFAANNIIHVVDTIELFCDTFYDDSRAQLAKLLDFKYPLAGDKEKWLKIRHTCIDSGYLSNQVYTFCRSHRSLRTAIKGSSLKRSDILTRPRLIDVTWSGKTLKKSCLLYSVGVHKLKNYCADLLSKETPTSDYVHFPADLPIEFYRELFAEKLITNIDNSGCVNEFWKKTRSNDFLDAFNYAIFCSMRYGIERLSFKDK